MSTQLTVIEPLDPIRAIDRADHLQQSTKEPVQTGFEAVPGDGQQDHRCRGIG
jgi:hypothetical protein